MNNQQLRQWCQNHAESAPKKTLIMAVLNTTPDSFSDGGLYFQKEAAFRHALRLIDEGADILDIGGESTRPGALLVSLDEEMDRVIPLIERIRGESDISISIDTGKAQVMRAAVASGAGLINDINALQGEGALQAAADLQVPVCLVHMQGTPETMQNAPQYKQDVIDEINSFFTARIALCLEAGILRQNLVLDPGFGFGKTVQHNLRIVKELHRFTQHKLPLALGVSRKSTIGLLLDKPVNERLTGGIVLTVIASLQGLGIIRTHDAEHTRQALSMLCAITN